MTAVVASPFVRPVTGGAATTVDSSGVTMGCGLTEGGVKAPQHVVVARTMTRMKEAGLILAENTEPTNCVVGVTGKHVARMVVVGVVALEFQKSDHALLVFGCRFAVCCLLAVPPILQQIC